VGSATREPLGPPGVTQTDLLAARLGGHAGRGRRWNGTGATARSDAELEFQEAAGASIYGRFWLRPPVGMVAFGVSNHGSLW
jgi:hypothetical protein